MVARRWNCHVTNLSKSIMTQFSSRYYKNVWWRRPLELLSQNAISPILTFLTNLNRFGLDHIKYLIDFRMLHKSFFHKMAPHIVHIESLWYLFIQKNHSNVIIFAISCASQNQSQMTSHNQLKLQTMNQPLSILMTPLLLIHLRKKFTLYLEQIPHQNQNHFSNKPLNLNKVIFFQIEHVTYPNINLHLVTLQVTDILKLNKVWDINHERIIAFLYHHPTWTSQCNNGKNEVVHFRHILHGIIEYG